MCRYSFCSTLPVLVLLCAQMAAGQTVRIFNTENGLPHNRVNAIYRDSRQFLWICTDDGLARFDGHSFVNYTTASGLPHRYVNAILETKAGEYWVATDGGLSRFDPNAGRVRFTTFTHSGPEEAHHINALSEEPDGRLLAGTSLGLYRFRWTRGAGTFEPVPLNTAKIHAIATDSRRSVWLGTSDGLFRRGPDSVWTHFDAVSGEAAAKLSPFVSSFARDKEGRLWAVFTGGFGRIAIDPAPGTTAFDLVRIDHQTLGRELRGLWFGSDGRRWVATNIGLKEWLYNSGGAPEFVEHTIQDRFPREAVISLGEDVTGDLWVGTRRSGLIRLGASRFQSYGAHEGLQLGRDQILLESQSGEVVIFDVGGKRSQVYRRQSDRQFASVLPELPALAASLPYVLEMTIQDRKGSWWFSTRWGLFRFPTLEGRPDLHLLPNAQVDRFLEDSSGDIWISVHRHGGGIGSLARWERRTGLVHDESHRLPEYARAGVGAFVQDRAGTLWIGLQRGNRLLRLKDGVFQPLDTDWRGQVKQLFLDSKGRIWATSTEMGLGLITDPANPKLQRYTRAEGLSADEVWSITEDARGRIYVGTAKGVDRLDPGSGKITHLTAADGLVPGDIRSALRDRNGDLWFASAHGVSRYKPEGDVQSQVGPTRITGVETAGVPMPLSEFGESRLGPIALPSHQNSLQITFAATDFRVLAPLRYQFLMLRDDGPSEWQSAGVDSGGHFVDLGPGRYTSRVRALTPDGQAGEPAIFTFAIHQPIWRTWWFQLAVGISIAAFAYWIRMRKLHQQLAIERVRSAIAMDLHDDIGAGLARISVIGESLKNRMRDDDNQTQTLLNDITNSSRHLVTEMGDIVWSLDPERDKIGELASRLRAFGSDLLEARGVQWSVDAPEVESRRALPALIRRQLYLVFKEAMHNIAKHSGASRATLRLWFEGGQILGELSDNGCGIPAQRKDGSGIPSMTARIRRLGGQFQIFAADGGGTTIRISVPLMKRA